MTRTEELLALAEAATHDNWSYGSSKCKCGDSICNSYHLNMARSNGGIDEADALFISSANPETIKQLVALCRLQHEALMIHIALTRPIDTSRWAIEAFNKFEQGGE